MLISREVLRFHALVVQADAVSSVDFANFADILKQMTHLGLVSPDCPVPGEVPCGCEPYNIRLVDAVF